MNASTLSIEGLVVFEPRVFSDDRGHFFESFNQNQFNSLIGKEITFVQDNESVSAKGVLRGLHFQIPTMAQGKLVRVVQGAVLDVAVDLRKNSPTYGQHYSIELSAKNKKVFWIPEGFGHGFLSLMDETIFAYKCTNYYSTQHEATIQWDDPILGIDWGISTPILSSKDAEAQNFKDFITPFI